MSLPAPAWPAHRRVAAQGGLEVWRRSGSVWPDARGPATASSRSRFCGCAARGRQGFLPCCDSGLMASFWNAHAELADLGPVGIVDVVGNARYGIERPVPFPIQGDKVLGFRSKVGTAAAVVSRNYKRYEDVSAVPLVGNVTDAVAESDLDPLQPGWSFLNLRPGGMGLARSS